MWDNNSGWKLELFADYLSEQVLGKIASNHIVDDEEAINEVYWNGDSSGGFSIKSVIAIIKEEIEIPIESVRG